MNLKPLYEWYGNEHFLGQKTTLQFLSEDYEFVKSLADKLSDKFSLKTKYKVVSEVITYGVELLKERVDKDDLIKRASTSENHVTISLTISKKTINDIKVLEQSHQKRFMSNIIRAAIVVLKEQTK